MYSNGFKGGPYKDRTATLLTGYRSVRYKRNSRKSSVERITKRSTRLEQARVWSRQKEMDDNTAGYGHVRIRCWLETREGSIVFRIETSITILFGKKRRVKKRELQFDYSITEGEKKRGGTTVVVILQ